MQTILRRSLFLVLALSIALLAGCGKKTTDDGSTPEDSDAPLTAEEQQAAAQISNGIVYFEYDRFDLRSDSQDVLRQKAQVLKQYPQLRVVIEGHCDERGTEEYNLALGERRARAAYDFLLNLGIPASQMEMVSFGKPHPAVMGSGESVWSKNRRDEFKAYKPR